MGEWICPDRDASQILSCSLEECIVLCFNRNFRVLFDSFFFTRDIEHQERIKERLLHSYTCSKDCIDSIPLTCIHKQYSMYLSPVFLIHRSAIQEETVSYIIHTVGYCDSETEILFESNLLYPTIPSHPQFYQLPGCKWNDLQSLYPPSSSFVRNHHRLEEIIKWNSYVYRNRCLMSSSCGEILPFVRSG